MSAKPFVCSVVIPAFNAERFLRDAVESVLAQVPAPAEIFVVDDGSEDGTSHVARTFGPPVVVLGQENRGIGGARNAGVARATGEYLAFLDADDVWPVGRVSALLAALDAEPGLDGAFGAVVEFGEGREDGPPTAASLASSLLIRRDSYLRVGPFREDLRVGEFIDWYARAQDRGLRFTSIPDVVLRRRLHESNTGRLQKDARPDYVRVLRAALERRRGAAQGE